MAPKNPSVGSTPPDATRFGINVMAHLDAAYNLARWLTRNERDAEDLVQEACLRAFKFLETFRGGNSRAWLLAIVRNTYYSGLKKNRSNALNLPLDEEGLQEYDGDNNLWTAGKSEDPLRDLEREEAKRLIRAALEELPDQFRETIVLREFEELSYQDIARIQQVPLGTVMSRLSRARKLLSRALQQLQVES